jgi:hypothetical protein
VKIEMGESLFYSWLRHVKECQVVQMNWKASPSWQLQNEEALLRLMETTDRHFQDKYSYALFKNNSLTQLLTQAEIDILGLCVSDGAFEAYAIDVAFHESGLNYGDRKETVSRVVKKIIRTVLCLIGYLGVNSGTIIFASPKIHNAVMGDLKPCIEDLNGLFLDSRYKFRARIIANEDFNELVLTPIQIAAGGVSDTSELFMRGFQLVKMFGARPQQPQNQRISEAGSTNVISDDSLSELKIGKIAQTLLRDVLESGKADEAEIRKMLTKDYSKATFGIDFPLLVPANEDCDSVRYYAKPLAIHGVSYRLCSQWFEVTPNNDRPFLMAWLKNKDAL